MSQPAMGAVGNGKWEPLSDLNIDEWFLLKDELSNKKVNESSSKPTKYEIAEQVLHDIEDLGRNNPDYWLDELPLFDEIQTQKPSEEPKSKREQALDDLDFILDQEPLSPKYGFAVADVEKQLPDQQDLFSISYEDAATFILSDENILYIDNEPFLSLAPLKQECENSFEHNGKTEEKAASGDSAEKENINASWDDDGNSVANDKKAMAAVEELLKSTALEMDQWESDTSRSEISSDGMTSARSSPKAREEVEEEETVETDDPDWKPNSSVDEGRKHARRSKSSWRGGSEEERKLRKKEQNKNAATRYRQKKKAEVCEILKEEESLKKKKAKLEERMADIQSEIKYLKPLMRELFRAKGIIK